MRPWPMIVNGLVIAFALFFAYIGFSFLFRPPQQVIVGVVFLLAAAPMFYYVFAPSAKGLPPAPKRPKDGKKGPPETL